MSSTSRFADTFLTGVLAAMVSIPALYYILQTATGLLSAQTGQYRWSVEPHPQLFTLLVLILVFRILVINLKREQTGRGWLFVTFLAAIGYAVWFYRLRNAS